MNTAKLSINSRKLKPGDPQTPVGSGMNFPAAKLIEIFEPSSGKISQRNGRTHEAYKEVIRYSGAGDMGLDMLGFRTTSNSKARGITISANVTPSSFNPLRYGLSLARSSTTLQPGSTRRRRTITLPLRKGSVGS